MSFFSFSPILAQTDSYDAFVEAYWAVCTLIWEFNSFIALSVRVIFSPIISLSLICSPAFRKLLFADAYSFFLSASSPSAIFPAASISSQCSYSSILLRMVLLSSSHSAPAAPVRLLYSSYNPRSAVTAFLMASSSVFSTILPDGILGEGCVIEPHTGHGLPSSSFCAMSPACESIKIFSSPLSSCCII